MAGQLALSDFRRLLARDSGFRGLGNEDLDLYINLGYREVLTIHPHKTLIQCATDTLPADENTLGMPGDAMEFIGIKDLGKKVILLRTMSDNMLSYDSDSRGNPTVWARMGSMIRFHPMPTAAVSLELTYVKEPVKLSAKTDTSIIAAAWDNAIYLFSMYYAKEAIEGEAAAMHWRNLAMNYIGTRVDEYYWQADSLTVPVEPNPRSWRDITGARRRLHA